MQSPSPQKRSLRRLRATVETRESNQAIQEFTHTCMCFASLLLVDWIWIDSKRKGLEAFISMDNCIIFFFQRAIKTKEVKENGKRNLGLICFLHLI